MREVRPRVEPTWADAADILVVRLDNLGDVLMTTPAITAVARAPGRRVTLLASRAGAAVRNHVPGLCDVLTYDAPWVKGEARSGQADRRFLGKLARLRFDAAIIFTVCTQSALPAALMCRMAGIPLRLAYSRENPYELLTDHVRDTETVGDGMRHEVLRQLDLVRSVGFEPADDRLVFSCLPVDLARARAKLFGAGGDPGRPYVVVHPGSTAPSRRYPPARFGRAASRIAAECGAQIVFSAGAGEAERADVAQAQAALGAPSVSLAGLLTVGELAALIGGARLLLCNNSGPAHLAAAAGTPVVVLYAATNPQHTPWRVASRVLSLAVPCRNCLQSVCPQGHHDCLLRIEADAVADAAIDLLRQTATGATVGWAA